MNRTPCTVVNMEANVGRLCTHQQTSLTTHNIRTPLKITRILSESYESIHYKLTLSTWTGFQTLYKKHFSHVWTLFVRILCKVQIVYILNLNLKFTSYSGEVRS